MWRALGRGSRVSGAEVRSSRLRLPWAPGQKAMGGLEGGGWCASAQQELALRTQGCDWTRDPLSPAWFVDKLSLMKLVKKVEDHCFNKHSLPCPKPHSLAVQIQH